MGGPVSTTPIADARSGRVGYPVPPGPSILEMMWDRLVEETEELLDINYQVREGHEWAAHQKIGICMGIAEMIAILLNPYSPNEDEVRTEVMRRIRQSEADRGSAETQR